MRLFFTAAALVSAIVLAGCDTMGNFDPLDKFQELDIMGSSKTPLKGERRPVFPEGVPGVAQGVPADMVKGYQPPAETPPAIVEAKPAAKAKPKKTAAVPRKPRAQPQPQQVEQAAPAPRTATQPVNQSASGTQTIPGAAPTWPTNAPPAPGPWAGPTR